MRHIFHYIIATACAGTLFTACQQEENIGIPGSGPKELTLSAESVSDRIEATTRAYGNTFFENGNKIKLSITPSGASATTVYKTYTYKNGVFSGNNDDNKYYFKMNDSFISRLVAQWPADRKDPPIDPDGTVNIPTDQRTLNEYRKADWLTSEFKSSTSTVEGIMPTDAPVPLHFTRNNARLEFEVQGQNAYGQSISSLILELQLKDLNASSPKATAFWAYCNPETGHAEVILPGGSKLTTSEMDYMIGRIAVAGRTEYTGTVIIPEKLDIELKANTSYLVTLTPRGDNLIASITIGGFGQDEEGIGLPFQLPAVISGTNIYGIKNASQLMTLSYILREYKVGSTTDKESDFDKQVKAIDWKSQKYELTDNIAIPSGLIWKPVAGDTELPISNFDLNGHTITGDGGTISFFK